MSSAASDQQSLNHLDKMRTTDGKRYSKTFKDTAPGHLTHIFCHTVISKIVSICDAFSSVHSVLHQFPECSNMAICCSKVRWSSSIASKKHKLHETIRNLKTKRAAKSKRVQYRRTGQSLHLGRDCMVQREKCQPEATE